VRPRRRADRERILRGSEQEESYKLAPHGDSARAATPHFRYPAHVRPHIALCQPRGQLEARDALLDLTNPGEIVIDPFLGSGSTLIAADKTGRVCRGELDPLYVGVIIRRFEAATDNQAVLIETGETLGVASAAI
jgi:hypothetical protein